MAFHLTNCLLPAGECYQSPESRENCGWYGINEELCESKGCCWDESVQGSPWCFDSGKFYQNAFDKNARLEYAVLTFAGCFWQLFQSESVKS